MQTKKTGKSSKRTKNSRRTRGSSSQSAPAYSGELLNELLVALRPNQRVTIQKTMRIERKTLEAASALCWWKRRDFSRWVEQVMIDSIVQAFTTQDVEISLPELIDRFRQEIASNRQKSGVLSALYDDKGLPAIDLQEALK